MVSKTQRHQRLHEFVLKNIVFFVLLLYIAVFHDSYLCRGLCEQSNYDLSLKYLLILFLDSVYRNQCKSRFNFFLSSFFFYGVTVSCTARFDSDASRRKSGRRFFVIICPLLRNIKYAFPTKLCWLKSINIMDVRFSVIEMGSLQKHIWCPIRKSMNKFICRQRKIRSDFENFRVAEAHRTPRPTKLG